MTGQELNWIPAVTDLAKNITVTLLLFFFIIGGYKKWWVWGWTYQACNEERLEFKAMVLQTTKATVSKVASDTGRAS